MSLLFLGVGNQHRGDDAVGPLLAQKFSSHEGLLGLGVDVIDHGGEGASLIQLWEGMDKVVIVDAMKTGLAQGVIRRFDVLAEKLNGGVFRYSSHLFGLAEAVEMARQLGKLPKEMIIYGIEGRDFDFGSPPAPPVEKAMREVEKAVLKDFGVGV